MTRLRRTLVVAALTLGISVTAVEPAFATPKASQSTSSYTVQAGDYLIGIALKLNVTVSDLLAVNKMVMTSLILPGQHLVVPASAPSVAGAPTAAPSIAVNQPLVYTVVKNDYLIGIAAALNVPIRSLLTTNHLVINSLIWPGMQLIVPAGGRLPQLKEASSPPAPTSTTSTAPSTTAPATTTAKPSTAASAAYVVVRGDSLFAISKKLGVTLGSLLAVNQLSVSSIIYPEMTIVVPAGGSLPVASTTPSPVVPPPASAGGAAAAAAPANVPAKVATVLAFVRAQLGKPYKAFMAGPDTYDCSGLTMAGYHQVGIDIPHYSGAQINFGTAIDWTTEPIRPGDLVFLETATGSGVIGHVGIATSATTWIHAPRTGDVVRTGSIPWGRVVGVRRLVNG